MTSDWFQELKNAKKSCLLDNNLKKIHFDFGDGREMVEEYNTATNIVTRRIWRYNKVKSNVDNSGNWEVEIGDPEPTYNPEKPSVIRENSTQPFVSRRITRDNLEWRIRNLPYPIQTYSVLVDETQKNLVVKTSNKKYYKKLDVPDLERLKIALEQDRISLEHKFNTLIITYKKPEGMVEFEKAVLGEIKKIQPKNQAGDMNCNPS